MSEQTLKYRLWRVVRLISSDRDVLWCLLLIAVLGGVSLFTLRSRQKAGTADGAPACDLETQICGRWTLRAAALGATPPMRIERPPIHDYERDRIVFNMPDSTKKYVPKRTISTDPLSKVIVIAQVNDDGTETKRTIIVCENGNSIVTLERMPITGEEVILTQIFDRLTKN